MEQIQDVAKHKGIPLFQAVEGKAAIFRKLIEDLRGETRNLPLPEAVEHVVARSGLIEHYKKEKGEKAE